MKVGVPGLFGHVDVIFNMIKQSTDSQFTARGGGLEDSCLEMERYLFQWSKQNRVVAIIQYLTA